MSGFMKALSFICGVLACVAAVQGEPEIIFKFAVYSALTGIWAEVTRA